MRRVEPPAGGKSWVIPPQNAMMFGGYRMKPGSSLREYNFTIRLMALK